MSFFISFKFYLLKQFFINNFLLLHINEYKYLINKESKKQRCNFFLKKARDKYNKPEERIKKITYEKNIYHNMIRKQKNKRREYKRNRNCNMTEKERRKEYARNRYCMMIKVC